MPYEIIPEKIIRYELIGRNFSIDQNTNLEYIIINKKNILLYNTTNETPNQQNHYLKSTTIKKLIGKIYYFLFSGSSNLNELKFEKNIKFNYNNLSLRYIPSNTKTKYTDIIKLSIINKNNKLIPNEANYFLFICKNNCSCINDLNDYCDSCLFNYNFYINEFNCRLLSEIKNKHFYINNKTNNKIYIEENFCSKNYPYEIYNTKECIKNITYNELFFNDSIIPNYYAIEDVYNLITNNIEKANINENSEIIKFGYNITFQFTS